MLSALLISLLVIRHLGICILWFPECTLYVIRFYILSVNRKSKKKQYQKLQLYKYLSRLVLLLFEIWITYSTTFMTSWTFCIRSKKGYIIIKQMSVWESYIKRQRSLQNPVGHLILPPRSQHKLSGRMILPSHFQPWGRYIFSRFVLQQYSPLKYTWGWEGGHLSEIWLLYYAGWRLLINIKRLLIVWLK